MTVEGVQDEDQEKNLKRRKIVIQYRWEIILVILTGKASKGNKNKKKDIEWSKSMDKCE